jgi:hypothetical protein
MHKDVDPITGEPKAAAPVKKSPSAGALQRDAVTDDPVDPITGLPKPKVAPARMGAMQKAEERQNRNVDPITGEPKRVTEGPRRSAGATKAFYTSNDTVDA